MKILITGGSGFIGSHLLRAACSYFGKDNVIALSSKNIDFCHTITYESNNFNFSNINNDLLSNVSVLIHAGAFTPKSSIESDSFSGCNGNIYFTEKLLSLSFKNLSKVIYLSTLDVYDSSELTTEDTKISPSTLYGLSKLYCEKMMSILSFNQKIPCHILRIGHVYGIGEEKYKKFIPNSIKSIINNGTIELWGSGEEMRSFIYVDDVVKTIINAINLKENIGIVNVVSGVSISIRDLTKKLIDISGKRVIFVTKEFSGVKRNYIFDNSKLRQYLLEKETDFTVGLKSEYTYMDSLF